MANSLCDIRIYITVEGLSNWFINFQIHTYVVMLPMIEETL